MQFVHQEAVNGSISNNTPQRTSMIIPSCPLLCIGFFARVLTPFLQALLLPELFSASVAVFVL